jgi:uncharacterized protein (TIGR03118 family)
MKLTSLLKIALLFSAQSLVVFASPFAQTNLVSNIPGMAANTDPNLKDPWGLSFSTSVPTSPFWISDRGAGVSTLYNGVGAATALVVTVPPGAPNGPTGQVFAGPTTDFRLNNSPVSFIFDTLGGTIAAWNGGTTATVMATTPGANYTGLALANNTLYAANFTAGGGINAFNSSFAPTTVPGNFTDPNLPAGYAPFNVQNINGTLYVEYAKVTPGVPVALPGGGGYVDEFDANGNLLRRLVSNGPLNGPWGVAVVPSGVSFGGLAAGDVLIGNFDTGEINVFDVNGTFLQTLTDSNGHPIVNDGLWSLSFNPAAPGTTDSNALYFTAGINGGVDGLFGKIDAVPEPAAMALAALGFLGLAVIARRRRSA